MIHSEDPNVAFAASSEDLLKTWYDGELRKTTGIGYEESQSFGVNFTASFIAWCNEHSLKQKICTEWDYCTKRKKYLESDKFEFAVALSHFIVGFVSLEGAVSMSVSVLIIKHGLGITCGCGEKKD